MLREKGCIRTQTYTNSCKTLKITTSTRAGAYRIHRSRSFTNPGAVSRGLIDAGPLWCCDPRVLSGWSRRSPLPTHLHQHQPQSLRCRALVSLRPTLGGHVCTSSSRSRRSPRPSRHPSASPPGGEKPAPRPPPSPHQEYDALDNLRQRKRPSG
ncbi:hypothetical protein P280DRAFT_166697 [Massarina eburnea CBS 473.64]|uniref:Uncharacterized protein n=1 Tax=Massarina eburnea CBS 473.64 TaxID=1395130 RepID=A0A6A6RK33_9PLEO|nr:hypothetical protein P280DRAFT_166697 [Massarina eburnea CBS 473.64]